jgi:ABC-type dipeptide/oligopeptide/nickel transport system permease subunit
VNRRTTLRLAGPALLVVLAAIGPPLAGPAEPPSLAASAAQLLAPGTLAQEVRIEGGGFVRAIEIAVDEDGLRVRGRDVSRAIAGVRAVGTVRHVRLWLGTDHQGRSLLARVVHGARGQVTTSR